MRKGDRVAIYLGMVPELPMAMLACARIGAAHSVVFGGFSKDSLRDRINDAECTVLVTGDGAWRRGKVVPLKATADDAVAETPSIEKVLVVRRTEHDVAMHDGRDVWYHDLVPRQRSECPPEPMDSEDLLFILYTSGTTGRPKGIMHTTGGYLTQVAFTHKHVFDLHPDTDVYWCAADCRVGHRPLVHRLRAAREPRDERHVRGHARPSGQGPLLVDHRAVPGDDPLHRANRDPYVHEVGYRVPGGPRPLVVAPARLGRRTHQPRGVDLVLEAHRR